MPQIIEVPNVGAVEFPDDMTDDQISSAIQKNTMKPAQRPNTRRLFDPALQQDVAPILTELESAARQGGVFGSATLDARVSDILPGGATDQVQKGKDRYVQARDGFAATFDLTPNEANDYLKHRFDLQKEGVSKDVFGQVHIKNEVLSKPVEEIRKDIKSSNLPDDLKLKYGDESSAALDLKLADFKVNTVASVKKNHPDLASTLELTGDINTDFTKITKELNDSQLEQLGGGAAAGALRSTRDLSGLDVGSGELAFSTTTPEEAQAFADRKFKRQESLNALSGEFNKSKVDFLGTGVDSATIGGGLYSAAESIGITALTGSAAGSLVPMRLLPTIGGAVRAGAAVQPVATLYATRQASDTYKQAIKLGKSEEEAGDLAKKAFGFEWGFTSAFSAVGLGGLESMGANIGREAIKKSWKGAAGSVLKTTLGENAEEGLINVFQTVAVDAKLNPDLTVDDLKKRAYDTFVATTVATGPISIATETFNKSTEELHDTADEIYTEKVLSETEAEGGDVETPSLPSVVTRGELEAEREKRIGELTDPEEIADLKGVDLDELAKDWGVELKQDETIATGESTSGISETAEPTAVEETPSLGETTTEITNDNQQPTESSQLEVPVSGLPETNTGTEGENLSTTEAALSEQAEVETVPGEASTELPPVAESKAPTITSDGKNVTFKGEGTQASFQHTPGEKVATLDVVQRTTGEKGSGMKLLTTAEEHFAGLGVERIEAVADNKPALLKLYQDNGYVVGTTNANGTVNISKALPAGIARTEIAEPLKEISAPEEFISALAEAMGLAGRVQISNKGKGELQQGKKGAVDFKGTASALISLFKSADQSTAVHEMSHVARRFLFNRDIAPENRLGISDADITAAEEFSGAKDGVWDRAAEEKFARGFERYVRDGKFPTDSKVEALFSKLAQWLQSIYKVVAGSSLDIELSPQIREIFDTLITRNQIIPVKKKLPPRTAAPKTTSVKNAETDKELEALGLSPVYDPGRKALQDTWDASQAIVAKDRFAGKKLVDELLEKPRAINDVEHGVLLDELAQSKLRAAKAQEELFAAQKAGVKVNDVQDQLEKARQDIIRVVQASKLAGTEWGRAGRFRQIRIEEDYTIEAMQAHYQAVVNDGAALSAADQKFVETLQAKIVAAEAETLKAKEEASGLMQQVEGLLKKLAEKAKVRAPNKARSGAFTANLDRKASEARERLKERGIGRLFQEEENPVVEVEGFHGTTRKFAKFDFARSGQNFAIGGANAAFFTSDSNLAKLYAENISKFRTAGKPRVVSSKLKLKNPLKLTTTENESAGFFDGNKDAILKQFKEEGRNSIIIEGPKDTTYIVFDNNAVGKLTDVSNTLFQDEETDPTIIEDLGAVGATWLQEGTRSLPEFTARLTKEFGAEYTSLAEQVFASAQEQFKGAATSARAKTPQELMNLLDKENPEISNKLIYNMVRGFINQGLEGDAVLDAVTKTLQAEFPNLTREDVAIAFTQYGKVKFPSQEDDLKKMRELRELERIQLQIDDIKAGKVPKKTGQQRDKPSVDIRELQKQRNELLKALNIKTVQKNQLRSSLDAVKTRLKNEIEELNHAIATKVAQVKRKPNTTTDAEVTDLKAKRDAARAHYDAVFGVNRKAITDQQRLNTAIKGLNKRIAEERALAAKGIAERTKNGKPISNDQVDTLRKTLNDLVKQRHQLRAALHPKKSVEEREMARAEAAAKRAIAAYANPTTKGKLHLTPSKELALLWEQRDALRAVAESKRKALRAAGRLSPEARALKIQLAALTRAVSELEARVKRGDLSTRSKRLGPDTLEVSELKKRQKAAQEALQALRVAQDTRTPEERRDAALVRAADTRRAKIEARIAANDYVKVAPVARAKTAALVEALHKEALAKAEWNEKFFEAELAKRSRWEKSRDAIGEVVNVSRTMMTMADISAVFRQGGLGFLAHPIVGARNIPGMFNAGLSEKQAFGRYNALLNRPNAAVAQEAKLFIAKMGPNVKLSEMEEAFRGRVTKKIPGIKYVANFSERTYADYLNHLRMDMFDAMVAGLPTVGGRVTTEEAKVIADYINKATGRGNLGSSENAAATLATVFFSPKFVASRFQWLFNIIPTTFNVATNYHFSASDVKRAKKAVAKEYTRSLIGIAAVYTLAVLAKAAWSDDDDKWEIDPRSSNAGKIKLGNTSIDPMAGLLQAATFAARMLTAKTKKGDEVVSLMDAKFGKSTYVGTAGTFVRSKLSPIVGTWFNIGNGQDLGFNKVTPQSEALGAFMPLVAGEIYETMKENGAAKGMPLALLSMLGVGVRNQNKEIGLEQAILNWAGDPTDYSKKKEVEKKLSIR